MKKNFSDPEVLVVEFVTEDVMTDSTVTDFDIDEDYFG